MPTIARCTEPTCVHAADGAAVEFYPGPGEYCPECGNALEPLAAAQPEPISPEAYAHFRETMMTSFAPPAPPRGGAARGGPARSALAIVAALALVAGAAFVLLRPVTAGRAADDTVRVCRSSITERFATDVVRSYAAKSGTPASRFAPAADGACDVQFTARAGGKADRAIAHDGIVLVVNPANGLARLSEDQVRRIFTGAVTDWSQLGGPRRAIVALLPADTTDEARAFAAALLHDAKPGASVQRLGSSADIVRAVAGARGRADIGVVAFSAAVPAKVLALGNAPAPSVLSIANHRYPLSVAITVESEGAAREAGAALVGYARSDEAQSIVVRDGLIAKGGF